MGAPNEIVAIPGPTEKDEHFIVGDALTIYEAAMVYAGRHPYPYFFRIKGGSIEDHLEFLRLGVAQHSPRKRVRAQRSWDIYREIMIRIEQGKIRHLKTAYDAEGRTDPCRTQIRTSDLRKLAKERGEKPRYLRTLLIPPSNEPATVQTDASMGARNEIRVTQRIVTRPARELARSALDEIYREGVPRQSEVPNANLCRKVGEWLKTKKQRDVSDATILRAAGRRL
jgi:hypothetical protein